jgi:uncharacterized protein YndB with AHSA1/START domain
MSGDEMIAEVRRRMAAPPARVFEAFADPGLVSRWLTPSPDVTLTVLDFEFRVGGKYRFAYLVPDGARMFVNGVYRLIEPPSRIVFSWNIEPPDEHAGIRSEVSVAITPDGSGAVLHVLHERLTKPGAAGRHTAGWLGAIDQLSTLLDKENK